MVNAPPSQFKHGNGNGEKSGRLVRGLQGKRRGSPRRFGTRKLPPVMNSNTESNPTKKNYKANPDRMCSKRVITVVLRCPHDPSAAAAPPRCYDPANQRRRHSRKGKAAGFDPPRSSTTRSGESRKRGSLDSGES